MSMCGVAVKSDCLTYCLSTRVPAAVPLWLEWHRLQDEDHPLRQAACCELVHFESPFRCRFEPLPRLPPACFFALAGVIRSVITGGLNVFSVVRPQAQVVVRGRGQGRQAGVGEDVEGLGILQGEGHILRSTILAPHTVLVPRTSYCCTLYGTWLLAPRTHTCTSYLRGRTAELSFGHSTNLL